MNISVPYLPLSPIQKIPRSVSLPLASWTLDGWVSHLTREFEIVFYYL